MTPVLSVVIPVYNAARTITRCIDSVIADLDSTPYSWELLLVDDGAEDDSLKIMQDYPCPDPAIESKSALSSNRTEVRLQRGMRAYAGVRANTLHSMIPMTFGCRERRESRCNICYRTQKSI